MRIRNLAVVAAITLLGAGCTPGTSPSPTPPASTPSTSATATSTPTVSPTPTSTPSPSPTWDDKQAAAIKAVEDYYAAKTKLLSDPGAYTYSKAKKLLEKVTGGDMTSANMKLWNELGGAGKHWEGKGITLWATAAPAKKDDRGEQVSVSVCRDSTGIVLVDKKGKKSTLKEVSVRLFSVRMVTGDDRWRVYGEDAGEGSCP